MAKKRAFVWDKPRRDRKPRLAKPGYWDVTDVAILKTLHREVLVLRLTIGGDTKNMVYVVIPAGLERAMEPRVEQSLIGETFDDALAALRVLAVEEGFDATDVRIPVEPKMEIR